MAYGHYNRQSVKEFQIVPNSSKILPKSFKNCQSLPRNLKESTAVQRLSRFVKLSSKEFRKHFKGFSSNIQRLHRSSESAPAPGPSFLGVTSSYRHIRYSESAPAPAILAEGSSESAPAPDPFAHRNQLQLQAPWIPGLEFQGFAKSFKEFQRIYKS